MEIIKTYKNQTLFDIAIQMYGHIEGVDWLLEDNPNTDFELKEATVYLRKEFVKKDVVKYLQEKRIFISTAVQNTPLAQEETHNEFSFEFNFEFN